MNDLISRQDAIDAVYDAFCYAYCDNCEKELDEDLCGDCHRKYQNWSASRKTVEKVINALPSAQPETCEGCKHLGKWENEVEYGYNSPCTGCRRRASDRYAR